MSDLSRLSDFLNKNSIIADSGNLPLIHTTSAYRLRGIAQDSVITPQYCEFFREDLNYFFLGRPAYKYQKAEREAKSWELPCCFIFDFGVVRSPARIYPFDSGAFHRKLYPGYINSMPINEFEATNTPDACSRLVGAFFGSPANYLMLAAKERRAFSDEFSLGLFDFEVLALNELSNEVSSTTFDDRRFTLEVQSREPVDLNLFAPKAVIAPTVYLDDRDFRETVIDRWGAVPLDYDIFSLSIDQYYGIIYAKINAYYKKIGLI